jgi:hypothetical protein
MANNRIYYAIQQVELGAGADRQEVHGLQSAGMTTNFNLEQVFEMGQLAIYQNIEEVPDIEVTLNKVLDGYPLLYVLATEAGTGINPALVATAPDIAGRQNARVDMRLSIYPDTGISATGNSITAVNCSGMYVSSVSYTFPVEGNFTEDVTLVGNDKVWTQAAVTGAFTGNDDEPLSESGVGRRQYLVMSSCRFPRQIPGINSNGVNALIGNGSGYGAHFQNVSVSVDLGREAIQELGSFAPYHRFVTFPVEVTSEFEVVTISGDQINASEFGYYTGTQDSYTVAPNTAPTGCETRFNLLDETIYLETCEGTKIYLGTKNKLTSVNYGGGDTGGGNATVTYSFNNFNDFVVAHSGDVDLGNFWADVDETGYNP